MNLNLSKIKVWAIGVFALAGICCGFAEQTNSAKPKDFSAFQIINERNIFDPNRRARLAPEVRHTPRPQQIVNSFSLVGTMSYSNLVLAFFDGTSADYRKSLEPTGKIAGFTVSDIGQNSVKLTSGTNEIILKVGMQMRRSEDGTWAATEPSASSYTSNSRSQKSERNERRSDSNRNGSRNSNSTGSQSSASETPPDTSGAPSGVPTPPPEMGALDLNDPVARLMLRRLQEQGGAAPVANDNPPENSTPENQEGNTNDVPPDAANSDAQPER